MTSYKTDSWDKRNIWLLPNGEMCVRPALDIVLNLSTVSVLKSRTIRNPRTNDPLHYVVSVLSTGVTRISLYDWSLALLFRTDISSTTPSKAVSIITLNDEVMIFSPDWAARWGIIGGPLTTAVSVASVNDINTKTLENIPYGIAVEWAGRVAVAKDNRLYFSDGAAPRSFVGANALDPPGGFIYGMHVSGTGSIYIVTSDGVYSLPETASISGQLVLGVWQKVTDYQSPGYNSSCVARGRVVGLTGRGYRFIDGADGDEVSLDDQSISRSCLFGRMNHHDYRRGRITAAPFGIIVSIDKFSNWTDMVTGLRSWMTPVGGVNNTLAVSDVLFDVDGVEMFVTSNCIRKFAKNQYASEDIDDESAFECEASIAGRIVTPPAASPRLREVTFMSDTDKTMKVFVNTKTRTATPFPAHSVIGVDNWGTFPWREPPLKSRRFLFHEKGDEQMVEAIVFDYPSKIPTVVDIEFGGLGLRRPNR